MFLVSHQLHLCKSTYILGRKLAQPSLVIGELQLKTTLRYYYTLTGMAQIKTDPAKCCWGYGAVGKSILCWRKCKTVQSLKKSLTVCYKVKYTLGCRYFRQEKWEHVHTQTCIWMFKAALFMIAENWKQPKYPSVGDWVKDIATWVNLRNILLNENSHTQNKEYTPYDLIYMKLKETQINP